MDYEGETPPGRFPPGIAIIYGDILPESVVREFVIDIAASGGSVVATDVTGLKEVGIEGLPVKILVHPVPMSKN